MRGAQGGEELERTVAGVDALRDTPARNGRGCCAISETCRGLMDNDRILELVVDACETPRSPRPPSRSLTPGSQTTPLLGGRRLEHPDEGLHLRLHGTLVGRSRAGHPRRAQRFDSKQNFARAMGIRVLIAWNAIYIRLIQVPSLKYRLLV